MIVTYFGWFCLSLLCIAATVFSICLLVYLYGRAMERFENAIIGRALCDAGRSIHAAGYWFSNHPQTTVALKVLGQRMMEGYGCDPQQWRAEWSRKCKEEGLSKSEEAK